MHHLGVGFEIAAVSELELHMRGLMALTHKFINKKAMAVSPNMITRPKSIGNDLYFASTPCQDFSDAGTHQGLSVSKPSLTCASDDVSFPFFRSLLEELKEAGANCGTLPLKRSLRKGLELGPKPSFNHVIVEACFVVDLFERPKFLILGLRL